MRKWHIPSSKPEEIAVLLFPRFSNHCLANAVEPLRATNELGRRDLYRWRFVTVDGAPVSSSSGLPVLPDCRLSDHPGGDVLFVLPSYDVQRHATQPVLRALKAAARRFGAVAGMDTGSWLMAAAGLLDGHRATIHPNELTGFSEAFDMVEAEDSRFVMDRRMLTCGGAMTAFDLVLELIARAHGEAMRLEVASFFMFARSDPPKGPLVRSTGSKLVDGCVALMSAHLEEPLSVPQLAAGMGAHPKTLARAFHAHLGAGPQTVYRRLRLTAARRYAEQSGYSIAEIALRCGYQTPAAMTRAFGQEFGKPPSAFRQGG
ncbi:MAG: helix-turn-helix domain-containing protein [Antarcticimicrobium sp.]|uniref:GlxA family transcriptional regulator n=1 Tax=Antarcticimicrobium sp. TaxID=2824147 RepID=UPI00260FAC57|nr:helix-turn-helix domain-containing protein [Antarcticimicrobium sp.]MDF1715450.1 helix-turn-helix domain-containing protein [Antarcticimicrobium sp.]